MTFTPVGADALAHNYWMCRCGCPRVCHGHETEIGDPVGLGDGMCYGRFGHPACPRLCGRFTPVDPVPPTPDPNHYCAEAAGEPVRGHQFWPGGVVLRCSLGHVFEVITWGAAWFAMAPAHVRAVRQHGDLWTRTGEDAWTWTHEVDGEPCTHTHPWEWVQQFGPWTDASSEVEAGRAQP